ncbi:hypothetical protein [Paenibacillus sp. FSL R10-2778]|uniref:hypothetical protein n=1 Tax=Paenibacillus sp. FSL R10-2778 TaxID=2954659 RepID=UPI0031592935
MKKRLSILLSSALTLGMLLSVPLPTFAQSTSSEAQSVPSLEGVIDLNNIDDLGDEVKVRDISYEEAVTEVARMRGVSKSEIERTHPDKSAQNSAKNASTYADTWIKEIKLPQSVGTLYKPELVILVWYYNSGSFSQFNELFDVQFDLGSHKALGPDKSFIGTASAKIATAQSIYWVINGHFYDLGTTIVSGGVEVGGKLWTGVFTMSYSTNHFKYWYEKDFYNIQ